MNSKIILDLCGGSGNWSKFYREAGYDVRIIDPLINGPDIRFLEFQNEKIHGILAAPPCTVFANSGARWKRSKEEMLGGLSIMDACLRAVVIYQPKFWVLENPVGKMKRFLGTPKMYFNPCDYGDPYTKKTCLWGNFNVPLKTPVEPTEGSKMHLRYGGKSDKTKRERSKTPLGFARAFFEANP